MPAGTSTATASARASAPRRPSRSALPLEGGVERCEARCARPTGRATRSSPIAYNEPGRAHHLRRLRVFAGARRIRREAPPQRDLQRFDELPDHAISSFDVGGNAIDLWRGLEETCSGDCDFITIPHNMNKGWGLFYSRHTFDGGHLRARRRLAACAMRRERLAEMYQVKGASECALGRGRHRRGVFAFSQVLEALRGRARRRAVRSRPSFARQGLKIGLAARTRARLQPSSLSAWSRLDRRAQRQPGRRRGMGLHRKVSARSRLPRSGGCANGVNPDPDQPDYQAVMTGPTRPAASPRCGRKRTRAMRSSMA